MIKIIFGMMFFAPMALAISKADPKLYFNVGTNYLSVYSNRPKYLEDFAGLNIGSTLEYQLSGQSSINLNIDAAYTPNRRKLSFKKDEKLIKGDSDLLTSIYSLNYSYMFSKIDYEEWYAQVGPAMGLYTLDFHRFQKNETDINRINRLRVRNFGARLSLKRKNDDKNNFIELAYIYMIQNQLTVIDDSSLDAQAVSKDNSIENDVNWGLFINYGWKLY